VAVPTRNCRVAGRWSSREHIWRGYTLGAYPYNVAATLNVLPSWLALPFSDPWQPTKSIDAELSTEGRKQAIRVAELDAKSSAAAETARDAGRTRDAFIRNLLVLKGVMTLMPAVSAGDARRRRAGNQADCWSSNSVDCSIMINRIAPVLLDTSRLTDHFGICLVPSVHRSGRDGPVRRGRCERGTA